MRVTKISATSVGSNGSAAGSGISPEPIEGLLISIYIDYASQPATTDLTFATNGNLIPAHTFYTLSNTNTDGEVFPRGTSSKQDGTAGTGESPIPLNDYVTMTIAQGDSARTVDAYLMWVEA